jgi:hypothetical protein
MGDLTTEQVQSLKRKLLKKGAEINEKLVGLMNGLDPRVDWPPSKPGETKIERLRRFLNLVDGEIQRIRAGTYGVCATCGKPLPFVQLDEVPWIDTCQACAAAATSG